MSTTTEIAWCDSTVNPTSGCDGCELWVPGKKGPCYAGNLHENRLAKSLPQLYAPDFTEVRLIPGRMAKAARWSDLTGTKRPDKPWFDGWPRVIFIGDMGDTLSKAVPFQFLRTEIIDVVTSAAGRRHVWMWLTKQAQRLAAFAAWLRCAGVEWPVNLWPGTSVTRQATLGRVGYLECVGNCETNRFLSVEPLLEPVNLTRERLPQSIEEANRYGDGVPNFPDVKLVIIGGESGAGARPCDTSWVRSIVRQCRDAGVSVFVKQMGAAAVTTLGGQPTATGAKTFSMGLRDRKGGTIEEWPEDLRVRQFPAAAACGAEAPGGE